MKATLDKKLKPLEQGVSEAGACIVAARLRQVYAGLRQPDFDAPPELEGNSMAEAPEIESSQLPMSSVAQVNPGGLLHHLVDDHCYLFGLPLGGLCESCRTRFCHLKPEI